MHLIEKVSYDLKKANHDLLLFKFLNNFIKDNSCHEYLETLLKLKNNLNELIVAYNMNQLEVTYNLIDNNFETFNDILNEYKNLFYPNFNVLILSLVTTLKDEELEYLLNNLFNYDFDDNLRSSLILRLYNACNYFAEEDVKVIQYFLSQKDLTDNDLEKVLKKFKELKKDINKDALSKEYILCIGLYFAYRYKE